MNPTRLPGRTPAAPLARCATALVERVEPRLLLASPATPQPYAGTPLPLPGALEFENYDTGGEGVAFHDTDAVNQGAAYRTESADVQAIPATSGGGYTLAFARAGEWTQYTVDVPAAQAGAYTVAVRYASLRGGGRFHLAVDGIRATPVVTVASTGDWQAYATLDLGPIDLTAGTHVLRLAMDGNDSLGYVGNFDSAWFAPAANPQTPFGGKPFPITGKGDNLELENFDNGGEGVAYHDTEPENLGGAYRPNEGVDVQPTTDTGGGYNVGFTRPSETLIYSIDTTGHPGPFALQARVASLRGDGRFHVEIDTHPVYYFAVPKTGGWQNYVTISTPKTINLSANRHMITVSMDRPDGLGYIGNFNWFKLVG